MFSMNRATATISGTMRLESMSEAGAFLLAWGFVIYQVPCAGSK
jgi:hypothetical protein